MPEKRNTILFGALLILSLSYWISSSFMIGDKPFQITLLEDEETELNENLISAQILASQLDRVFTLFQENLALSKMDSLADDANLPFLNNLTDILDDLDITLMGIKPKPREDKRTYLKAPYLITLECTFEQFGKFLSEIERSPRLITVDEFEVKNGTHPPNNTTFVVFIKFDSLPFSFCAKTKEILRGAVFFFSW